MSHRYDALRLRRLHLQLAKFPLAAGNIDGQPAKVRCRTCHNDHDYRHEQAPPPKSDTRKQALFDEVLKKVNPEDGSQPEAAAKSQAKSKSKKSST